MREKSYGYMGNVFVDVLALEKYPSNPSAEVHPRAAKEPPPKKTRTRGLANTMVLLRVACDDVMQLSEMTNCIDM
jgi:hypothetical protein